MEGYPLRINSSERVCMCGVWVSVTVGLPKCVGLSKWVWVSDCVCVNVRDSGRVLVSVKVRVSVNAWF